MGRLVERASGPLVTVLLILAALANIWTAVFEETIPEVLRKRMVGISVPSGLSWVPLLIGVSIIVLQIALIVSVKRGRTQDSSEAVIRTYDLKSGNAQEIRAIVAAQVIGGLRISVHQATNALVVTGTTEQHGQVESILRSLNIDWTAGAEAPKVGLRVTEGRLPQKLRLVFDPNDRSCVVTSSVQEAIIAQTGYRNLRLRVENASQVETIQGVRVLVERIESQDSTLGRPALRFIDDRSGDGEPSMTGTRWEFDTFIFYTRNRVTTTSS